MSAKEQSEERLASLLIALDEALAAGKSQSRSAPTPPELVERVGRGRACLELLHQVRPRRMASETTVEFGDDPSREPGTVPPLCAPFGRFQILRELGRGGFGVVFLARDPKLGRHIALKVPHVEALVTAELRARFQQEARAAAALDHPNIVPVYEAGEVGPVCYIASAYCPGMTLAAWLKQQSGMMPPAEAARLMATLAEAVEHAHSRGVLHRDLKPGNILVSTGFSIDKELKSERSESVTSAQSVRSLTPKIADFGLAKVISNAATLTQSGAMLGTPSYMAPEQASGDPSAIGSSADIYALGAVLYETLTGRPPFQAPTPFETLEQVRTMEPVPPRRLQPKVPLDLETICLKCLRKEPNERYTSARALGDELVRFLDGTPILARPVSSWERSVKWARRRPAVAGLLAALALVLIVGFATITAFWRQTAHALVSEHDARLNLEASLATRNILLARFEWTANRFDRAQALLLECAPKYRDADWHYVWRASTAETSQLHAPQNGGIRALVFQPDGSHLAAAHHAQGGASIWDLAAGKRIDLNFQPGIRPNIGFNSTGRNLAFIGTPMNLNPSASVLARSKLSLIVWDMVAGNEVVNRMTPIPISNTVFSVGGPRWMAALYSPQETVVEDVMSGVRILTLPNIGSVMNFSSDGRLLVTTDRTRKITFREIVTGKTLGEIEPGSACSIIALSGDNERVALGSVRTDQGTCGVTIWQVKNRKKLAEFVAHTDSISGLVFSPHGTQLASSSLDRTVKLWDATSGQEIMTFRGHTAQVLSIVFHPRGHQLASGDRVGCIRFWNVAEDRPIPVPKDRGSG